tara:strand:+ start:14212 stop:15831 length:1620 start_codon:yes stop_codon:yes gene_type:complete
MKYSNIILSAGPINTNLMPVSANLSQGMIPINGKPVIAWIIDDLISKNLEDINVVVNNLDTHLIEFLERSYCNRIDLKILKIANEDSIINSLVYGLQQTSPTKCVRIILGDTLIHDSFEFDIDMVYIAEVNETKRWCIAKLDSDCYVTDYVDKGEELYATGLALAGYYHFTNSPHLLKCALTAIDNNEAELSAVLTKYSKHHPIKGVKTNTWHDFGHVDNLAKSRRDLLQPRHFNSLEINPVLNTITKTSLDQNTLKNELNWYLNLPEDLKILAPRLINFSDDWHQTTIVQEYYGYPTLAELYVYAQIQPDSWLSTLKYVLNIHNEFSKYSGEFDISDVRYMYKDKTLDRIETLSKQSSFWNELLSSKEIVVNGKSLKNLPYLTSTIEKKVERLIRRTDIQIIHGDFCFSNILYDLTHQIIRLIDPRGAFGKQSIYGDPRYDLAKLRHSVSGLYDFVLANMFKIDINKREFNLEIYTNKSIPQIQREFDNLLIDRGHDLNDLIFIQGLIFISLTPLHEENFERQLMLYLTGIETLNQVI